MHAMEGPTLFAPARSNEARTGVHWIGKRLRFTKLNSSSVWKPEKAPLLIFDFQIFATLLAGVWGSLRALQL